MAQWLEREFTDWKVRVRTPLCTSTAPGQPGSIPALVLPSGSMATRHQKGVTAERLLFIIKPPGRTQLLRFFHLGPGPSLTMSYRALADVVHKILEETIPLGKHPILALAKTDQEKQKAKGCLQVTDDEKSSVVSTAERRRWLREAYKKPQAAAGIRQTILTLNNPPSEQSGTKEEVEWEHARERRLRLQATRGIVALFNSVRQHQSSISSQLDNSDLLETQKERILTEITTSDFLDRLSAGLPKSKLSGSNPASSTAEGEHQHTKAHPVSQKGTKRTLRTTFGVTLKKKHS
ncbi:hypothetical protein CSKR_113258 [Clonorchis sinensis]|uniref:RRP15-like protein n=1 Tax=Clonorchis sinensis TaxID=79923 RepID=A0A3R7DGN3_CLOSI|nr:hypothetical protein CSKR_113258 [Clonorchis sinensis]